MKHRILLLCAVLGPLAARPAPAQDRWTVADKITTGLAAGALLADWSTTEWAVERHGWTEANPLLGPHPSSNTLTWYTLGHLAAFASLEAALPRHYGRLLTYVVLGIESYALTRNRIAGAHFAF